MILKPFIIIIIIKSMLTYFTFLISILFGLICFGSAKNRIIFSLFSLIPGFTIWFYHKQLKQSGLSDIADDPLNQKITDKPELCMWNILHIIIHSMSVILLRTETYLFYLVGIAWEIFEHAQYMRYRKYNDNDNDNDNNNISNSEVNAIYKVWWTSNKTDLVYNFSGQIIGYLSILFIKEIYVRMFVSCILIYAMIRMVRAVNYDHKFLNICTINTGLLSWFIYSDRIY